ncbi:hypothetical protein Q7P37_000871 [Cladosporium fusiforme]
MDLPRPLEPRSNGHSQGPAISEPTQQHIESNGHRPGQMLPGLRDILTPASHNSPQSQQSAWSQAPAPRYEPRSVGNHDHHPQQPNTFHPHPPLHPPSEPHGAYPAQHDRRLDLPILETQPVTRQPPAVVQGPSYAAYRSEAREGMDPRYERPRQTSAGSYMTAGAPSPYTPLPGEHSAHRNSTASYDRSGNPPFTPTGAEASKKYLGIKDFPGEGTFHVYDGGYRIPTSVDGETVNPQWGLTKANKPRKRLALACLDCREKKIKCEPGASSCLQCEKAKRPCRRAPNQPVSGENSGNGPWSSETGSPPLPPHAQPTERATELNRVSDSNTQANRTIDQVPARSHRLSDQDSFTKRRAQDEGAPEGAAIKKHRSTSPATTFGNSMAPGPPSYPPYVSHGPSYPRKGQAFMSWEEDPYSIDPDLTIHLLELYFSHVNNATYCMFPRVTFMNWLTTSREKCQNERMVLYALLAMGSVFAGQEYSGVGKRCAELAMEGSMGKIGRFGLPVVQVRLLLALYNFAKGNEGAAWDYCGLGIRAISALRLNHEEGCEIDRSRKTPLIEYGLTREQGTECRRRTFWAGYLMDRYNGFCGGMLCTINPADIYLRLPCAEDAYESSMPSQAPFYNNGTIEPSSATLNASSPVSPMAWLTQVASIWGEVMGFIYRSTNHNKTEYRRAYEAIYGDTHAALQDWSAQLPGYLQYSEANLDRSIQERAMPAPSYPFTHALAPDLAPRNIRAAHHHAHRLLGIMRAVQTARRDIVHHHSTGRPSRFVFSVPFPGYATLSAVDIIGAGGPESTLGPTLDGMANGLECLRELAQYWSSALEQSRSGERRLLQLKNVLSRPYKASSGCWLGRNWGIEGPLEQEFELESDCIYGCDDKVYFSALEDGAVNGRAPPASLRGA